MEKINFVNDTTPALNATNLNKLQQNVEDAIGDVQTDINNKLDKTSVKNTYSTSATDTYSCNYVNSIVESGSNTNGTYIKYADGTMICTKQLSGSASFSVWFSPIYLADVSAGSWPQSFVSLKSVVGTNTASQTSIFAIYDPTITSAGTARIINIANSTGTKNYNLNIVAIGTWK